MNHESLTFSYSNRLLWSFVLHYWILEELFDGQMFFLCAFNLSLLEKFFWQLSQGNDSPPCTVALCLVKCLLWVKCFPHSEHDTIILFSFTWKTLGCSNPCSLRSWSLSMYSLENCFSHSLQLDFKLWWLSWCLTRCLRYWKFSPQRSHLCSMFPCFVFLWVEKFAEL